MKKIVKIKRAQKKIANKNIKALKFPLPAALTDFFTNYQINTELEGSVFAKNDISVDFSVNYNFHDGDTVINKTQLDNYDYLADEYLCFGRDLFGNLFVINVDTEKVFFFNHDEDSFVLLADDLLSFIEGLELEQDDEDDEDDEDFGVIEDDFSDDSLRGVEEFKRKYGA